MADLICVQAGYASDKATWQQQMASCNASLEFTRGDMERLQGELEDLQSIKMTWEHTLGCEQVRLCQNIACLSLIACTFSVAGCCV